MEHPTDRPRFRYLDADEVDDSVVNFNRLDVRGPENEKLGDIDGFIVDPDSGRLYFAVVDSGGWFTSRRFLLPIGHATVDRDRGALRVDVTKDSLRRYPEFDEDRFRTFSDEDLRAFERRMADACCPDEEFADPANTWGLDTRRHYSQPDWWGGGSYDRERLRPVEARPEDEPRLASAPVRERHDPERVTARERDDASPHPEGRAQPGDVLGIETGGERTHVGETAEDENQRRRDAEKTLAEQPPRHSDR